MADDDQPADPRTVLTRPAPRADHTLRYGNHPDQVIDLRVPTNGPGPASPGDADQAPGPPRPLVVVIHGGFWRAEYDRAHTGPLATDLARLGYPVAQLEYRRTGPTGGGWPGTFEDVAAGLDAVPRMVAETLPADVLAAGPPVLLGHSAGGQLALWYAATAPDRVRGVLALAPVADLAEAYRLDLDDGAVARLLGGGPDRVPDRYRSVDPARRIPVRTRTVILHGDLDRQVPLALSERYFAAGQRAGADVELIALPECEHFGLIDPTSAAWVRVTEALASLHRDATALRCGARPGPRTR